MCARRARAVNGLGACLADADLEFEWAASVHGRIEPANQRKNVQMRCGVLCEFTLAFFGGVLLAVASESARVVHAESLPSLWESLPIS